MIPFRPPRPKKNDRHDRTEIPRRRRASVSGRLDGPRRGRRHLALAGQEGGPGRLERRAARPGPGHRRERRLPPADARRPRGAGDHPPRRRPRAGPGGAGTVPRHSGDDRPGHRGRLLLRLRPRRALLDRRLPEDREEDGRDHRPGRPAGASGLGPRHRHRPLRGRRRNLQGRVDPRPARERDDHRLQAGRMGRPVPGSALPDDQVRGQGLQADQAGGRLLARRFQPRPASAHLRHGLGEQGGPGRLSAAHRGGREARPPQAGPRHGALPHAGRGPGHGLLAPQGLGAVARAGGLYAPPSGRRRLCRGEDAAGAGPQVLGGLGPLGQVPPQYVRL